MKRCPHRVNVDLQHCWECEPQAPVDDTKRGTGRTSRMLLSLPADKTVTVVVHTQCEVDYVRRLATKLRPDLKHPIRVRIVRTERDCEYLRGCDFVVDHAVLERASGAVVSLLCALGKRRELTRWESNP